jgi:hypothetical protein
MTDALYTQYVARDARNEPGRKGYQQMQDEARGLADAFSSFIDANPNISYEMALRIFGGFVRFYFDRHPPQLDTYGEIRFYPFQDAINEFTIIGVQMLVDPTLSYEQIYQMFYTTQ